MECIKLINNRLLFPPAVLHSFFKLLTHQSFRYVQTKSLHIETLFVTLKTAFDQMLIYSRALAKIEIGCSHRLLVDISICHLQVSQSVATQSMSASSICLNKDSPTSCEVL